MDILLRKKKLYDVENKDEMIETHYREYQLSFSLSRPFISLIVIDTAEIVCGANLYTIRDLFRKYFLKCKCKDSFGYGKCIKCNKFYLK